MQYFEGAEFVGEGITSDNIHDIFDLGSFPAVTEGKYKIKGEVYAVDDETFEYLDAIEGYPDFYNRKKISVNISSAKVTAYMYFIDRVTLLNSYKTSPVGAIGDTKEWN